MNKQVYFYKGLPASGKTTAAKDQIRDNFNSIKRINKDDLRNMMDGGKWSKDAEKFIIQARNALVALCLANDLSVIVDDTNLHPKHESDIKELAEKYGARFIVSDFTDVPVDECIKRDQHRANYIGEKVIKKMHNQFLSKVEKAKVEPDLHPAWVFDLDGTLADHSGRSPYDYELCEGDTVNESVRTIMNNVRQPRHILLVSGRPEDYRMHTERWLKRNGIEWEHLFMRKSDDRRNDSVVKREIYETYIKRYYNVVAWFDDRLRVCREIHHLGLPLFRVGDPDADF